MSCVNKEVSWIRSIKWKEKHKRALTWHTMFDYFFISSVREWPLRPQQRCRLPGSHPHPLALCARLLLFLQRGWVLRCWWVLPEQHFPQTLHRVSIVSPSLAAADAAYSEATASQLESNTVIVAFARTGGKMPLRGSKVREVCYRIACEILLILYLFISPASCRLSARSVSSSCPQSLRASSCLVPY